MADLVEDSFKHPTLSNVRLTATCLLALSGFLRSDELISLRPCDIKISSNMMAVTIRHSKTDQLRQWDEVLIARTSTRTCPVTMLERYMELADIAPSKGRGEVEAIREARLQHPARVIQKEVGGDGLSSRTVRIT